MAAQPMALTMRARPVSRVRSTGIRANRYSLPQSRTPAIRPLNAAAVEAVEVPEVQVQDSPLAVKDVYAAAAPFHVLRMDKPSYYDGRAFADTKEVQSLAQGVRMYAEFCQCTYSNYLPVRKNGVTPIPSSPRLLKDLKKQKDPGLLKQVIIAATGTQEDVDKFTPLRAPALPEELFLAPHPTCTPDTVTNAPLPGMRTSYAYTAEQLSNQYGFLEPDSPIVQGGFKAMRYLYASSGIFDSGSGPSEVYWIGYISYSAKLKEIVLSFRGTVHASEWEQNADIAAQPATDRIPAVAKDQAADQKIMLHQGFCEMYYTDFKPPPYLRHFKLSGKCLKKQVVEGLLDVLKTVKDAEAKDPEFAKRPLTLSITGHSLGGALSTIAAYDLVHDDDIAAAWPGGQEGLRSSIQGVTFAQPKAGNAEFVRDFNSKIQTSKWLRVLNVGDIVTQLPFATLPVIRELADDIFAGLRVAGGYLDIKREKPDQETLLNNAEAAVEKMDLAGNGAQLLLEIAKDRVNFKAGTYKKAQPTIFEHVGWQMRFDPDHPNFPYVASFNQTHGPVRRWLKSTLQYLLRVLQLRGGSGTQLVEDTVSLSDANVRHNLDVIIHMIDPTTDKVRMNRQWNCLVVEKLSSEEIQRLGDRYCWWAPFSHSNMRLVKEADGSFKWICVEQPKASNGAAAPAAK